MKIRKRTDPPDRKTRRRIIKGQTRGVSASKTTAGADFKKELADISRQELQERLDSLLLVIDRQGEKLQQTLDRKDLLEYRRRVKEFLRTIQKEYARIRQFSSWDRRGNLKTYRLIEQIDGRLDELHRLFMEEQTESLEVLRKLDEIRGLLMDLYI